MLLENKRQKYIELMVNKMSFLKYQYLIKDIIAFIIISCPTMMYGQGFFNPDKPMIVPFIIEIHDINERVGYNPNTLLYESTGHVFLPPTYYTHNTKSHGIIVVRTFADDYHAFDARCARCFYKDGENDGTIKIPVAMFGECDKCSARVDNIVSWGSGQMSFYDFNDYGDNGPIYLDTYPVKVIRKDHNKRIYLWIYNAPNGVRDEWKEQPENQIVVEGCRELFGSNRGW